MTKVTGPATPQVGLLRNVLGVRGDGVEPDLVMQGDGGDEDAASGQGQSSVAERRDEVMVRSQSSSHAGGEGMGET